jgi:hypothetical protein
MVGNEKRTAEAFVPEAKGSDQTHEAAIPGAQMES